MAKGCDMKIAHKGPPVSKKRRIQKKWRKRNSIRPDVRVYYTDVSVSFPFIRTPDANGVMYSEEAINAMKEKIKKGPTPTILIKNEEQFIKIFGGVGEPVSMGFRIKEEMK